MIDRAGTLTQPRPLRERVAIFSGNPGLFVQSRLGCQATAATLACPARMRSPPHRRARLAAPAMTFSLPSSPASLFPPPTRVALARARAQACGGGLGGGSGGDERASPQVMNLS